MSTVDKPDAMRELVRNSTDCMVHHHKQVR
jgi:hypothetical protein